MADYNCGTRISDECNITGIDWRGDETAFRTFCQDAADLGLMGINMVIAFMAAELSENLKKALNSARCAISSGVVNIWTIMASVYYVFSFTE